MRMLRWCLLLGSLVSVACSARTGAPHEPVPPGEEGGRLPSPDAIDGSEVVRVSLRPSPVRLRVGESIGLDSLRIVARDARDEEVDIPILATVEGEAASLEGGILTGNFAGSARLHLAFEAVVEGEVRERSFDYGILVEPPPIDRIVIPAPDHPIHPGAAILLRASAYTAGGERREDVPFTWRSSDPTLASVDGNGFLRGHYPGRVTVTVEAESVRGSRTFVVRENPVAMLDLSPESGTVRTGDVIRFRATPRDFTGRALSGLAVSFAVGDTEWRDRLQATVFPDGSFVADGAGSYRVKATVGTMAAEAVVTAEPRRLREGLWEEGWIPEPGEGGAVWSLHRGEDGTDRIFRVAGTRAELWDLSDPISPELVDTVALEAGSGAPIPLGRRGAEGALLSADLADPAAAGPGGSGALRTEEADTAAAFPSGPEGADPGAERSPGALLIDPEGGTIAARPVPLAFSRATASERHLVTADATGRAGVIHDRSDPAVGPVPIARWRGSPAEGDLLDLQAAWERIWFAYGPRGIRWLDPAGPPDAEGLLPHHPFLPGRSLPGRVDRIVPVLSGEGNRYLFLLSLPVPPGEGRTAAPEGGAADAHGEVRIFEVPADGGTPFEVARLRPKEGRLSDLAVDDDRLYLALGEEGVAVIDLSGELRGDLLLQGRETVRFVPDPLDPFSAVRVGALGGRLFVEDGEGRIRGFRLDP